MVFSALKQIFFLDRPMMLSVEARPLLLYRRSRFRARSRRLRRRMRLTRIRMTLLSRVSLFVALLLAGHGQHLRHRTETAVYGIADVG